MTDPSYADLTKLMAPVFDGHIEMVHVETNGNPGSALTAPITDLKYIALKEGKIKQDLLACFTGDESAAFVSNLGMFYGQAIEKPSTFVLFVPWESVEVSFTVYGDVASTVLVLTSLTIRLTRLLLRRRHHSARL